MNCLLNIKNMIELLDLPDEMILAIMNKVKPRVLLLCSMIGIENNRLEQLALDKCHSIDLTFDYYRSQHELLIQRFYLHVLPCIYNNIQSLTINLKHVIYISFAVERDNSIIPLNLTHLKILRGRVHRNTGIPITLGDYGDTPGRLLPLYSIVPELFHLEDTANNRLLSFFRSPLMRSIVSFEFDDVWVLLVPPNHEGIFFPQSSHLTHIRVTLFYFHDCIRLLNQIGSQLHSFAVILASVCPRDDLSMSQMTKIRCPNLKRFTMTIYRNIRRYDQLLPLFSCLSAVEHLTLLLAIGITGTIPDHFIDGFDLQRDIISHMPHLHQFHFHIRSILSDAPDINVDTIRQSFIQQKQPIDCVLDYFNNNIGQCQIYSLPFIGTRLDFISNRFPLFDVNNRFSSVTTLLLFDDVKPFESVFFERLVRFLPHLKTLDVFDELEQEEKTETTTNLITFPHLAALILHNIHADYAEQLLCRSRLPRLVELVIRNDPFVVLIAGENQQARDNFSKVERLQIVEPWIKPTSAQLNFFPLI